MIANIILGLTIGALILAAVSYGRWSARRDIRRQADR